MSALTLLAEWLEANALTFQTQARTALAQAVALRRMDARPAASKGRAK
jgi:hypothetical protein